MKARIASLTLMDVGSIWVTACVDVLSGAGAVAIG
jgi:hypothetical protein